jgi:glucose-6-phosphate 1-dehydrogenase
MTDTNPTQIIILGGTGDLSKRKLIPALLDLFARGMLPKTFHIIGLARSHWGRDEYQTFVKEALKEHHSEHTHCEETLVDFCSRLSYVQGSFDDKTSYDRLKACIEQFDTENNIESNRLFYLAVPPTFYADIFTDLKNTDTAKEYPSTWTHILVEKPFGHNLKTAQKLDSLLASLYREDQIFRIDHYLAKQAVQNILSFRFANTLLQAPWSNESIQSVDIKMLETIDVGSRAGFYEGVGALRDVGQNHLLQLVALVAMRQPESFSAEHIRSKRAEVFAALKPIDLAQLEKAVLRAQYEGYKTNEKIPNDSDTETYFELKTELNLPEWTGVPFNIQAGKALDHEEVSITITFKDVASGLFETKSCLSIGNQITLTISPEQTIAITLNAKSPGLGYQLESRKLAITCTDKGPNEIRNSYEKVLFDSITGDHTLFTRTEEVLAAWEFITPILEHWQTIPLHTYAKGSSGPVKSILQT